MPSGYPAGRLDAALGYFLPDLGLRARRRLWKECRVLVNGRALPPGGLVKAGDVLRLEKMAAETECRRDDGVWSLVFANRDYAVFDKPSGLHSVSLRGSNAPSLETLVAASPEFSGEMRFLSRLDIETSGLVPAALNSGAEERFRLAERAGQVRKTYLGLAAGAICAPLLLKGRIQSEGHAKSRVCGAEDADPTRHSRVFPLLRIPDAFAGGAKGSEATLARIEIGRGARHQIRAHLAFAGHPLLGDTLYGGPERSVRKGDPPFFLHHALLVLPDLEVRCPPPWIGRFAARLPA
ncbi:MAG: RNA pseudouridine synthase [Desulfovibrio sp.]|nr:RNA pseudouridine synthase [Desulfovibrio sp.]